MATKEELLEKAKELDIEGRSSMNKEELEKAVSEAEGSSSDGAGVADGSAPSHESEASDLDNENVKEGLSPEGQDAAEEMGDEAKELADAALDASGPLHLESPHDRIMTGAVNEDHAKEQAEALKNVPDDYVGDVTEAGDYGLKNDRTKGAPKDNLSENDERDPEDVYEVRQEHVIDYPAPLAEREEAATGQKPKGDETVEERPNGAFGSSPIGTHPDFARSRLFEQKSVFYTDGLSGHSDHNFERAYEIPEVLQSNDPETRKAGDESLSEAAKAAKEERMSDHDRELEESAKSGDSE